MCYAYGRGHYRTFDGNNYYFYGTCKYQMVYVKDSLIRFSVSLINDPNCDVNGPCQKKVEVVMEDAIVMLGSNGLDGIPRVTINNEDVIIPYKKRTPSIRMVGCEFFARPDTLLVAPGNRSLSMKVLYATWRLFMQHGGSLCNMKVLYATWRLFMQNVPREVF